ncbi:hypothetical protein N7D90_10380 [Pseudomonas fragi]|nr:hypothetical protein N7D90_10380 [Pseudomonas fragi]
MAKVQREKQKMKTIVLKTRRDVVSELIRSLPGGCKFASDLLGMKQKKFENHAYENNKSSPLTAEQVFQLELVTGTSHYPEYVAAMYGGMFVLLTDPEALDNVELYTMCVDTAAKRGTVDQIIAQALEDGVIDQEEADSIRSAESQHMAARHAEVLAVIQLHAQRTTTAAS